MRPIARDPVKLTAAWVFGVVFALTLVRPPYCIGYMIGFRAVSGTVAGRARRDSDRASAAAIGLPLF